MNTVKKCFKKTAVAAVVGLSLAVSGAAVAMNGMGGMSGMSGMGGMGGMSGMSGMGLSLIHI